MSARPKRSFVVALAIGIALCALAFIAAPASCDWGLSAYVWSGAAAGFALFVSPLVLEPHFSGARRALWGAIYLVCGACLWFAALFAFDMRIVCRLF